MRTSCSSLGLPVMPAITPTPVLQCILPLWPPGFLYHWAFAHVSLVWKGSFFPSSPNSAHPNFSSAVVSFFQASLLFAKSDPFCFLPGAKWLLHSAEQKFCAEINGHMPTSLEALSGQRPQPCFSMVTSGLTQLFAHFSYISNIWGAY